MPNIFKTRVIPCQPFHKVQEWSSALLSEEPLLGCVKWERRYERCNYIYFSLFLKFLIHLTPSIFRGSLASNFLSFSRVMLWKLACFLARHLVFSFLWFTKSVITHPNALYHLEFCYHLSCAFIASSLDPSRLKPHCGGFVEESEINMHA